MQPGESEVRLNIKSLATTNARCKVWRGGRQERSGSRLWALVVTMWFLRPGEGQEDRGVGQRGETPLAAIWRSGMGRDRSNTCRGAKAEPHL